MIKKILTILIGITFATPVFAQTSFFPVDILPTTDSTRYVGTTTGAFGLKAWKSIISDSFYDTDASDGCATWLSNVLTSTGSSCGSGGGGGGGTWSTTTSQVSGQLINYPNNTTDIVTIGSNSTTTAEFWFDPNTSRSLIPYASSTAITAISGFFTNLFIGADTLAEYISDTAGAMWTGNTETGGALTYQDADNTVDFVCNTASGSVFGCLSTTDWTTFNNKQDTITAGDALTLTGTDIDFDGGTAPGGSLGGTWASPTIDDLFLLNNGDVGTGVFDFGGATSFEIPNGTGPTVDAAGEIAVDTTTGQLKFFDGADTHILTGTTTKAFNIASSTLDAMGNKFSAGTTTLLLLNDPEPLTLSGFYCTASTTGTALVRFGDGTNWTNTGTCTTGSYTPVTSNGTFTSFEAFNVQASSTTGTTNRVSITAVFQKTAD